MYEEAMSLLKKEATENSIRLEAVWAAAREEKQEKEIQAEGEREHGIEFLKELLAIHKFKFKVGGCGCCGSPWVKVTYRDEDILDSDHVVFDMFEGEEKE